MEPTTIPLKRTPPAKKLSSVLLLLLLGILPASALPLLWFVVTQQLDVVTAGALALGVCFSSVAWIAWLFALPKPAPITVDEDKLTLPFARVRQLTLALDEIVVARSDKGDLILVAATTPGTPARGHAGALVVPRGCFAEEEGAAAVVDAIRARLALHAHGPALLARLDENAARQAAFVQRRPFVTWGVAAACALIFAAEVFSGALSDPKWLVVFGANVPARVVDGEVWRLVTACLLHGSLLHLGMNLSGLLSTGAVLERWLGRSSYAVILLVSGAGGHLGSALFARAPMSVGLSGALFGLLGVLLWSTLRFRKQPLGGLRVSGSSWLLLLLMNAALSTVPFVDVVAHAAGFVSGLLAAIVLAPRPGQPPLLKQTPRFVLACIAAFLVVAAVVAGIVSAAG